ncbi:hypothetical protein NPIL_34581 [Nephila pilipes]|uniref:Uncharacterized protein n=1 Tax=Nephila pilipes TaxID=299642 RepID=A0A8X6QX98_NEPPI|nr:hypothetical protein NPIL_34581 [Nephila pilipes]
MEAQVAPESEEPKGEKSCPTSQKPKVKEGDKRREKASQLIPKSGQQKAEEGRKENPSAGKGGKRVAVRRRNEVETTKESIANGISTPTGNGEE